LDKPIRASSLSVKSTVSYHYHELGSEIYLIWPAFFYPLSSENAPQYSCDSM
jgi:hypothetical protein